MNAEEFDRLFDEGADITDYIDWATARRPNLENHAVTVDLPQWIIQSLDHQARIAGVTRDALVSLWLAERLQHLPLRPIAAE